MQDRRRQPQESYLEVTWKLPGSYLEVFEFLELRDEEEERPHPEDDLAGGDRRGEAARLGRLWGEGDQAEQAGVQQVEGEVHDKLHLGGMGVGEVGATLGVRLGVWREGERKGERERKGEGKVR